MCHSIPEIHHADQGVQYLSSAYIAILQEHRIEISVAQRGRPWENGYPEGLIRTLKEEEVDINDYQNITEARDRIGHFITQVYHQKRPIGVNFRKNNRRDLQAGRFGFPTEPDFIQKPRILQTPLQSRSDGICVEMCLRQKPSPVGATSIENDNENDTENP